MRAHYNQIIRDYNKGIMSKTMAIYGLVCMLLEAAEEGLLPSDVAFMLDHGTYDVERRLH